MSEQVLAELLVNCRKAYWCPAAPDARSAATPSVALGQPVGPAIGPAADELAGAGEGLLGAAATEEGAAVGRTGLATAVALQLAELVAAADVGMVAAADVDVDGVLVGGAVEAAGCSMSRWSVVFGADVQAVASASVVNSSSVSRRVLQP